MHNQDLLHTLATPANTIDEVIDKLSTIIHWSKENDGRIGYFAALYQKVTITVQQRIEDGFFDDGERMERLDVIFANRYIQACHQYQSGKIPTQSWTNAFNATHRWWPIVLQHLLMGMNAHINLDLGIAAAETVSTEQLKDLRGDFEKINQVLASLVGKVQEDLARIWPILGKLNRYLGDAEKVVLNFSMEKARDAAWSFAEELAPLEGKLRTQAIKEKDALVAEFSNLIIHPGLKLSTVLAVIRLGERGTIRERVEILK